MALEAVNAISSLLGAEAQIAGVDGLGAEAQISAPAQADAGFGATLTDAIGQLDGLQKAADAQQVAMATGQADDINAVVLAAERAQLAMQLATQLRNGVVGAYQELYRTQI